MIEDAIAKPAVEGLIKNIGNVFREIKEEFDYHSELNIKKYLNESLNRLSEVKTILHGSNPVNFYNVYYPLTVKIKSKDYQTNEVKKLFSRRNAIVIVADAGSGKSMLFKHLFLNSIISSYLIPVMIELRYFNDSDGDFNKYLKGCIDLCNLCKSQRIEDRFLSGGELIFFFDGFDEIKKEYKPKVMYGIKTLIEKYPANKYIISTRPYTNVEMLPNFVTLNIRPLSEERGEISGFIDKQLQNNPEIAKNITQSIATAKKNNLNSFLSNPLLLSLYILTYQTCSDIPSKKSLFYRRVIDPLLINHDSITKSGFPREKASNISPDKFDLIMKRFCIKSYFENKISFDYDYAAKTFSKILEDDPENKFDTNKLIEDLKLAFSFWIDDSGTLSFTHRSLQEFFAASFIKDLPTEMKVRAYDKIKQRLKNHNYGDIFNLLSILEEVDYISFWEYYYIDSLKELSQLFRIEMSNYELVNSVLDSVVQYKEDSFGITYNNELYYYFFCIEKKHILNGLWKSIHQIIKEYFPGRMNELSKKVINHKSEHRLYFSDATDLFIDKINNDEEIKKHFHSYIKNIEHELEYTSRIFKFEKEKLSQIVGWL